MKIQKYNNLGTLLIFFISFIYCNESQSQVQSMSGPRLGITLLAPGETADILTNQESSPSAFMTQYGWQWESRFADGGEITGLVEWVLLAGGMERGKFLPSVNSLVGFRTIEGFELGIGPSLTLGGIGMVFGIGFTGTSGKLNIPINFVFSPKKEDSGSAFSVLIGFNMNKN